MDDFVAAGASVIGVSLDSIERLNDFSADPEYCAGRLAVASDPDGAIAASYELDVREGRAGMTDTREYKLPVWAQDLLADERRRAALAWPTEARPEPLWEPGSNVYVPTAVPTGETVWLANPHQTEPTRYFVDNRHVKAGPRSTPSRPEYGRYFATKRDAWVDMWWAVAETASHSLFQISERMKNDDNNA